MPICTRDGDSWCSDTHSKCASHEHEKCFQFSNFLADTKMPHITTEHTLPTHLVGVGKLDDEGHEGLNLLGLGLWLLGADKSGLLGQSTDHARLGLPAEAAHEHTPTTDGSTAQTTAEGGGSTRRHTTAAAEEGRAASAELLRLATAETAEVEESASPSQEGRATADRALIAGHCYY